MKIKCPNILSYKTFKNIIITKKKNNEKKHIQIISVYPVLKTKKNNSKFKHNFETVNYKENYHTKSYKIEKTKPKILNVIWKKDLKKNIPKIENEDKKDNDSNISNFLNYNLGEIEKEYEEFSYLDLNVLTKSLNENKKEEINIEYDIKGNNSILLDKKINDNINLNFKKIVKSKSNLNNRKNNLKNTSNYLLNIDEYFPNEKINSVYNSNKMAFITQ